MIAGQPRANLGLIDVLIKVDAPSFVSFGHDFPEHFVPAVL